MTPTVNALAALLAGVEGPLRAHLLEALRAHIDRCQRTHHIAPPVEFPALIAALTARNGQDRPTFATADDASDDALVPLLLDPDDAARQLGISERSLRRLERSGEVKAVRIGRAVRFAPEDLQAFVEERRTEGAAPDVR